MIFVFKNGSLNRVPRQIKNESPITPQKEDIEMKEVPLNSSTNPPHADVDVLWLTTFFALREQIDFFPLASSESSDDISTAFVLL
jgi:hypothetical protein